jgi:hypothetical protein
MKNYDEWDKKYRPFIPGTERRFLPDYPYAVVHKGWVTDFNNRSEAQYFFDQCNPGAQLFWNDKIPGMAKCDFVPLPRKTKIRKRKGEKNDTGQARKKKEKR